jgi:hypothetical protein
MAQCPLCLPREGHGVMDGWMDGWITWGDKKSHPTQLGLSLPHKFLAFSTLMLALLHALLHFVLLTSSFRMFSIRFIHLVLSLSRLFPPTLSALCITLASLSSLILSICPNHLHLFHKALLESAHFSDSFIPYSVRQLKTCK